jgi:hypothetical protein
MARRARFIIVICMYVSRDIALGDDSRGAAIGARSFE